MTSTAQEGNKKAGKQTYQPVPDETKEKRWEYCKDPKLPPACPQDCQLLIGIQSFLGGVKYKCLF